MVKDTNQGLGRVKSRALRSQKECKHCISMPLSTVRFGLGLQSAFGPVRVEGDHESS